MTVSSSELTLSPRRVKLTTRTGVEVRRTLPHKELRMIGAWCFVDHFGPTSEAMAMSVAAHPHTGLQTATWLFEGSIAHNDSLGSRQVISPGELNLMTAGRGISHSELSVSDEQSLAGVQLWIALPESVRHIAPSFLHLGNLPVTTIEDASARVFIGEFQGVTSPATVYSPLVGAEVRIAAGQSMTLELRSDFEYGFLAGEGNFTIDSESVSFGELRYLSTGHTAVTISAIDDVRVIVLGGQPFEEKILMWWNFICRTHEEITQMRDAWENGDELFGSVSDDLSERIPAPEMPAVRLNAR